MKKRLLKMRDLDIGYKKGPENTIVQKKLNLTLNEGELICLIGPNGVGKSTLLKTLGRTIPAVNGDIMIRSKSLLALNQKDFSRNIGVVLTEGVNVPQMRVHDIIAMGRFPYTGFWGQLKSDDLEIIEEVAIKVGVFDLLKRFYNELSDGEKQKVMIAKVLAQKTPVMLLDEPTAFLDFPTKSSLLIMLRKLARENNIGIILSTHDIELAIKTADQIWLFPQHHEMINGIPEDLILEGDILKIFENKNMNFNKVTGHFERVIKPTRSIAVEGDALELFWLKKAFLRNDVLIDRNSDWMINYDKSYSIYFKNKAKKNCTSIEEVLAYLKIK